MKGERGEKNDREYTNGEITVFWKPSECIHATTCYRELIEVFNPRKRPWVDISAATSAEIIRVVDLCPTSALTYKWNKEGGVVNKSPVMEEKKIEIIEIKAAEVRVMKDGPLIIRGDFKIIGANGSELRQMKMASFCRCGQSRNMPFCDGTHRKVDFFSE